jgi:hypothetical protein
MCRRVYLRAGFEMPTMKRPWQARCGKPLARVSLIVVRGYELGVTLGPRVNDADDPPTCE